MTFRARPMQFSIKVFGTPLVVRLPDFAGGLADAARAAFASPKRAFPVVEGSVLLVSQSTASGGWYMRPDAVFELRDGQVVEAPTKFLLEGHNAIRAVKILGEIPGAKGTVRVWPLLPAERPDWSDAVRVENIYDCERDAVEAMVERIEEALGHARSRLRELADSEEPVVVAPGVRRQRAISEAFAA